MKRFAKKTVLRGVSLVVIGISIILGGAVTANPDPNCSVCKGAGQNRVNCATCSGKGHTSILCPTCKGSGRIITQGYTTYGWGWGRQSRTGSNTACSGCNGTGQRKITCNGCNGTRSFLRDCACLRQNSNVPAPASARSRPSSPTSAPAPAPANRNPVATVGVEYCKKCEKGYITTKEECNLCEKGVNHLRIKEGEFECRLCKEKHPTRFTKCSCGLDDCPKCDGRGFHAKKEQCTFCVDGVITPLKARENAEREALALP